MKYKKTIVFMYVILALPIPISLISWIGTIISVANIKMLEAGNASVLITAIIALSAMVLAGTYSVTYSISLFRTLKNKSLTLFILFWSLCE